MMARPIVNVAARRPQFVLQPQYHPQFVPHFIIRNGPVITNDNPPAFNDRYDPNAKWYFPDFALKTPLLDNFTLKCYRAAPDSHGNRTYAGEAAFVISKSMPSAVKVLNQTPGHNYKEIPLQNLTITLVVNLADNSALPYPAQLLQHGEDYTATISLGNQESLESFYRFISDSANGKFCKLSIGGAYFGYIPRAKAPQFSAYQAAFVNNHLQTMQMRSVAMAPRSMAVAIPMPAPAPPHNPADDYDVKESIPFSRTIIGVNYDCHAYPESYLVKLGDNDTMTAFGCKPPFGNAEAQRCVYTVFNLTKGNLADKDYGIKAIYRNTYNDSFLVVPARYVIALDQSGDEQLLIPAARLYTSIDLKDIHGVDNSTADFRFNIAPEVSQFQLVMIKQLILSNLPASLNKTIEDIFVAFPEKIHDRDKVVFDSLRIPTVVLVGMGAYQNGVTGSKYFNLQFQSVSIGQGHAEWVAQQAKIEGPFPPPLATTITLDVDSDTDPVPESSIALSLNRVAGNGLVLQTDANGSKHVVNRTFYDISVDSYETSTDRKQLATALLVPANNSVNADSVGVQGDLSLATFEYAYHPNADYLSQTLKEIRVVNLDTINDDIIVTNNTGLFSLCNITSIDFAISIIEPGETDPAKALAVASTTLLKDGVINHVPFTLPVAKYLSKWSAVYSTVVNFTNGSQQVNAAQLIDDLNSIGKLINLTVSKLNLSRQ